MVWDNLENTPSMGSNGCSKIEFIFADPLQAVYKLQIQIARVCV